MQSYKTVSFSLNEAGTIGELSLDRASKKNALSILFFSELPSILEYIDSLPNLRVLVLSGKGKVFSAGLDLKDAVAVMNPETASDDFSRKGIQLHDTVIAKWQEAFSRLERLKVPVIASVHSFCIGGAIDLILSADIRYSSQDAMFSVKEVDIGMCADIGTT